MDKCLGFGGVGDCFIIILKLLEHNKPLAYMHIVDTGKETVKLSEQLLDYFNISNICIGVPNIKEWWIKHHNKFDKCFNVFAKGYIHIPKRPYHWEPCRDDGYKNPFRKDVVEDKTDFIAVQINSNERRTYRYKPIVEYVYDNFNRDKILWFGTDLEFTPEYGINYCGKIKFISALEKISSCKNFVGFNSILLYWSLWNKLNCFLFTDHQGKNDLRIHDEWKKLLNYDI